MFGLSVGLRNIKKPIKAKECITRSLFMADFAPGMRTIIRDEEWMVKKIETNSLGNKALHCIGISPLA